MAFAATEPINTNSLDGKVKKTSSGTGSLSKPFDFSAVSTTGISGSGGAPTTATYITQTPNASLSAEQALSALATGLLKNTTGTGVLSIAVAGTDYLTGNQTITLSGDMSGSGTTAITTTLATVNSNVGSFTNANITVNAKGLVTAAANGSSGSPGGSNTQVLFNDGGAFGADADFTWDKTNNVLGLASAGLIGWPTGAADTALSRNAAGVVEINNGTAGQYRDLKARDVTSTARIYAPTMTGGSSGEGYYLGTSASRFGSLQALNSGGFTFLFFGVNKYYNGTAWTDIGQSRTGSAIAGANDKVYISTFDTAATESPQLEITPGKFFTRSDEIIGWGSGTTAPFTADTALARNAAGTVEVNNGTAGTFRDVKVRSVNATTDIQINGTITSADYSNASTSSVSAAYSSDTYLAGSSIVIPAGAWKAKGQYHCVFDMAKTNVGTATPTVILRMGTLGTTSDAAILTFTLGAGTAVADTGWIELFATFRTIGSGTSAVLQGTLKVYHTAASGSGLTSTADKSLIPFALTTSSGFNSTTQTTIGLSFNGGASFSGTNTMVQAQLIQ